MYTLCTGGKSFEYIQGYDMVLCVTSLSHYGSTILFHNVGLHCNKRRARRKAFITRCLACSVGLHISLGYIRYFCHFVKGIKKDYDLISRPAGYYEISHVE